MNADLKAKWVAALRSGDYKQTEGLLFRDGAFCCLGVLCDVAAVPFENAGNTRAYRFGVRISSEEMICGEMRNWFALENSEKDRATLLAEMNDSGETFATIADWIDANIPAEAV